MDQTGNPRKIDLDMLANEISEILDDEYYGVEADHDTIREALPAFLNAIRGNSVEANEPGSDS